MTTESRRSFADEFKQKAVALLESSGRPGSQWAVGRAYNQIVKEVLDESGVEISFPHLTVYMGENKDATAPPVRVQTAEAAIIRNTEPQSSFRGVECHTVRRPRNPRGSAWQSHVGSHSVGQVLALVKARA